MSDLGDLLELIHTAHLRPKSLRAVIRHWAQNRLAREAVERLNRRQQAGSIGSQHLLGVDVVGDDTVPATSEITYRVWGREPGRYWRVEWRDHRRENVAILNGQRWWSNTFGDSFWTNVRPDGSIADNVGGELPSTALQTMFAPTGLTGQLDLQTGGRARHARRAVIAASGKASLGERLDHIRMISLGWPYADDVRILVDAREGILLRYEMLLDGEPFMLWDVVEIELGRALEDALFEGPEDAQLPKMPGDEEIRRLLRGPRPPPDGPRRR
jgi:hypothetical protein